MSKVPVACKDCGRAAEQTRRGRCATCNSANEARRNAQLKRQAYKNPAYLAQPFRGLRCWNFAVCGNMAAGRDHLVPVKHDPLSWMARPACTPCNSGRGAKP